MLNRSKTLWALLLLAASASVARAQICFPPAQGLSGGPGAPNWWSPGATPVGSLTTSFLDDPRWHGALSHEIGDYERFRVLVEDVGGARFLVMSWELRGDLGAIRDRLYFGLWDDATNTGNIYRLTRVHSTQTTVAGAIAATGAFSGRVFAGSGPITSPAWTKSPIPPPPLPAWLTSDARVDVTCSSPPSTGCDRWAFRVRAPLSATANPADPVPAGFRLTGPNFHFWFELHDTGPSGTVGTYSFPSGIVHAQEGGTPPLTFPTPATWRAARIGSGAGCENDVSLQVAGVWVNSAGSTLLNLTSNDFHAQPINNTPGSLQNDVVTARFRVANWGSVSFASPEWRETCRSAGVSGSIGPGSAFDLRCTWTGFDPCPYRPAGDACGPLAGSQDPHQCILVELDNAPGSLNTLVFSPQSVIRNMDFDTNSVLTRQALIDTRGLPPMANGADSRDLYLLVQTRNLPQRVPRLPPGSSAGGVQPAPITPAPSGTAPTAVRVPPVVDDVQRVREISALRARFRELQLPSQGAIDVKSSLRVQDALRKGRITLDQVELLMPTYRVLVWHDTGALIDTEEGPEKVFESQPSFGLFLAHDGELEGWEHRFEGAEKIGDNLYKITAERDGVAKVTATIAPKGELPPAVAPPGATRPGGCGRCDVAPRSPDFRFALVATLAFVGFAVLRVRRRRSRS